MKEKLPSRFLEQAEVMLIGYSKRGIAYCGEIRRALEKRGAKVHPVNPTPGEYGTKVYESIGQVPGKPASAIVLTKKERNGPILEELAAKGVRYVLFASSMAGDAALRVRCEELGMEHAVACPLMALGGGFHRFHGMLAGVRKLGPTAR